MEPHKSARVAAISSVQGAARHGRRAELCGERCRAQPAHQCWGNPPEIAPPCPLSTHARPSSIALLTRLTFLLERQSQDT